MGEEEPNKVEEHALVKEKEKEEEEEEEGGEASNGVAEEKRVTPAPDAKASTPPAVEKVSDLEVERSPGGTIDREAVLARVLNEKRLALIKAWEESEKSKAENKAYKKQSDVDSWENSKKASVDVQLKKIEEKMEKKKAEYAEEMKNKVAEIHKAAEEKRAMVEVKRKEEFLMVEETAVKFRAAGYAPKKFLGCFSY